MSYNTVHDLLATTPRCDVDKPITRSVWKAKNINLQSSKYCKTYGKPFYYLLVNVDILYSISDMFILNKISNIQYKISDILYKISYINYQISYLNLQFRFLTKYVIDKTFYILYKISHILYQISNMLLDY